MACCNCGPASCVTRRGTAGGAFEAFSRSVSSPTDRSTAVRSGNFACLCRLSLQAIVVFCPLGLRDVKARSSAMAGTSQGGDVQMVQAVADASRQSSSGLEWKLHPVRAGVFQALVFFWTAVLL